LWPRKLLDLTPLDFVLFGIHNELRLDTIRDLNHFGGRKGAEQAMRDMLQRVLQEVGSLAVHVCDIYKCTLLLEMQFKVEYLSF
jgi:hypothetical protein